MKKVFVSQPIENMTEDEINVEKIKAVEYLESKGYNVINKNFINELNNDLKIIGKDIYNMAECDAIYFTNGWSLSKKCRVERLAALLYNIEILKNEESKNNDEFQQ